MTLYFNSPQWFYGIDSIIEASIIIVAALVCIYSYKIFRITNQKKYLYFSSAFFLTAISYIFKIISEIVIYSRYVEQRIIGPYILSRTIIEPVTWIHTYSHSIFRLLITLAFFILIILMLKIYQKPVVLLLGYFMLITIIFGHNLPFIFHMTHVMMIGLLLHHFYKNYKSHKTTQSLLVTLSFLGILISHILFVFMQLNSSLYVIGESFQVLGFGLLLIALILVKKK